MKPFNTRETKAEVQRLYRYYPETKRLLRSLGCDALTAEDLFQEALIIFIQRNQNPDFHFTVEPIHYIKQTCKFLWFNEARKRQKNLVFTLDVDFVEEEQNWLEKEQKMRVLETALEQLGKQCRELLQLFYGLGKSMVDIAKKLDLRNEKVAKTQKYRCIQKAKELVRQRQVESI